MHEAIDLSGQRFGKLFILERVSKDKFSNNLWLCKCDCGNEKLIPTGRFRQGTAKSCGCVRKNINERISILRYLYYRYKRWAKHDGKEFSLSLDEYIQIVESNCSYCGSKPPQIFSYRDHKPIISEVFANGIDRIDSSIGYVIDNVTTCCKACNYSKRCMSQEEFYKYIKNTYLFMKGKGFYD